MTPISASIHIEKTKTRELIERDILFIILKNGIFYQIPIFEKKQFFPSDQKAEVIEIRLSGIEWQCNKEVDVDFLNFVGAENNQQIELLVHFKGGLQLTMFQIKTSKKLVDEINIDISSVFTSKKMNDALISTKNTGNASKTIAFACYLFGTLVLVVLANGKIKILNFKTGEIVANFSVSIENPLDCRFTKDIRILKNSTNEPEKLEMGLLIESSANQNYSCFFFLAADAKDLKVDFVRNLNNTERFVFSEDFTNQFDGFLISFNGKKINSFDFIGGKWVLSVYDIDKKTNSIEFVNSSQIKSEQKIYNHVFLHEQELEVGRCDMKRLSMKLNEDGNHKMFKDCLFAPNRFSCSTFLDILGNVISSDPLEICDMNYFYSNFEKITQQKDPSKSQTSKNAVKLLHPNFVTKCLEFYDLLLKKTLEENEIVCIHRSFSNSSEIFVMRKNRKISSLIPTTPQIALFHCLKMEFLSTNAILSNKKKELCENASFPTKSHGKWMSSGNENFVIELMKRLLTLAQKADPIFSEGHFTLECLAAMVSKKQKQFSPASVSVFSCFETLVERIAGRIDDENFTMRHFILQNKEIVSVAIENILGSLISSKALEPELLFRFPELVIPIQTPTNFRSIQLIFYQILKQCQSEFMTLFIANLFFKFMHSFELEKMIDLSAGKQKLKEYSEEKLQNLLFIYSALKEPVHVDNLPGICEYKKAIDFRKHRKELYVGELLLIQGFTEFGLQNGFLLAPNNPRTWLSEFIPKLFNFFENKNFLNGESQLANLNRLILRNVF